MNRLGDLVGHADVLGGVGLRSSAIDGGSALSRGSIVVEVVNHLGIKLLNCLGLSTAGVAAARTSSALSTAGSLVSSGFVVLLGLGSSGGLGASLVTKDGLLYESKNKNEINLRNALSQRLGCGDGGSMRRIIDNLDLFMSQSMLQVEKPKRQSLPSWDDHRRGVH